MATRMQRDVAVVGFSDIHMPVFDGSPTGVELIVPIFADLFAQTGWTKSDIGFWCSGSSDYLAGRSFSFVSAVDAIGALPPVNESHVEMDAAWALYEAWVKIQTGEVDTAIVYGFGKSSASPLRRTLALQLDPYTVTPLWPDTVSIAGIQARLGLERGVWTAEDMAAVAARAHGRSIEEIRAEELYADPLRRSDIAPVTDGAAAMVLAASDALPGTVTRPAFITGFEHRIDSISLGSRDLTRSPSAAAAAAAADVAGVELAELHAPFSHQELILRKEFGLGDDVSINPSGGPLVSNPMFSGGLTRIGEAARRIWDGTVDRALGHATSGPALQQNLVCVLEGRNL